MRCLIQWVLLAGAMAISNLAVAYTLDEGEVFNWDEVTLELMLDEQTILAGGGISGELLLLNRGEVGRRVEVWGDALLSDAVFRVEDQAGEVLVGSPRGAACRFGISFETVIPAGGAFRSLFYLRTTDWNRAGRNSAVPMFDLPGSYQVTAHLAITDSKRGRQFFLVSAPVSVVVIDGGEHRGAFDRLVDDRVDVQPFGAPVDELFSALSDSNWIGNPYLNEVRRLVAYQHGSRVWTKCLTGEGYFTFADGEAMKELMKGRVGPNAWAVNRWRESMVLICENLSPADKATWDFDRVAARVLLDGIIAGYAPERRAKVEATLAH